MTKNELIKELEKIPEDVEVYFWNFVRDGWQEAKPYFFVKGGDYDYDINGNKLNKKFIGIE